MADTIESQRGRENNEWGHIAEEIARDHLIVSGYTIREMNWRMGNLFEVDIIAEMGNSIIFVEVKARKNIDPVDAVNNKKRKLMIKAANIYLNLLPRFYEYRFDIITISGTRDNYVLDHIPDAFLPPLNGRF